MLSGPAVGALAVIETCFRADGRIGEADLDRQTEPSRPGSDREPLPAVDQQAGRRAVRRIYGGHFKLCSSQRVRTDVLPGEHKPPGFVDAKALVNALQIGRASC